VPAQLPGYGWCGEFFWSTEKKEEFKDHSFQKIANIVAKYGGTVRILKGNTLDIHGIPDNKKAECASEVEAAMIREGYPLA